jgi:hypothetical protein
MARTPPHRQRPTDLAGYLEALSRPVFQAGMSWRVVEAKWDGIREAFARFDPRVVAGFGPDDVERLLGDTRIVRSRPKIEATIDNAQTLLDLDAEYGAFARYLGSHGGYEETVTDLTRRFRFIGPTNGYIFLYLVDEPVPPHHEWSAAARGSGSRRRGSRGAPNA